MHNLSLLHVIDVLSLGDPQSKNHLHLFYKEYSEAQILCQADPPTRQQAPMIGLDMRYGLYIIKILKSYLNL